MLDCCSTKGVKIVRDQRLESVRETEIGIGEVETEDIEIIQKEVAETREEGIEMKMMDVQGIVTIAGQFWNLFCPCFLSLF